MDNNIPNRNIPQEDGSTPNISRITWGKHYTMADIKRIVDLRYEHYSEFGRKMGWTKDTVSAVLNGHWIPTSAETIRKMADELGLNRIKLATLFARLNQTEFVSADKYQGEERDEAKIA